LIFFCCLYVSFRTTKLRIFFYPLVILGPFGDVFSNYNIALTANRDLLLELRSGTYVTVVAAVSACIGLFCVLIAQSACLCACFDLGTSTRISTYFGIGLCSILQVTNFLFVRCNRCANFTLNSARQISIAEERKVTQNVGIA
jgi:hypothetical protein